MGNMYDDPDYILELDGVRVKTGPNDPSAGIRPYISVYFECCRVYNRIYRNRQHTAYVGWCPRCMRKVRARIGHDGIDARFFRAT